VNHSKIYIGREVVFKSLDPDSYYNLDRLLCKLPKLHSIQILEFRSPSSSESTNADSAPEPSWDDCDSYEHRFLNIRRLVVDGLIGWPTISFPNIEEITLIRRFRYHSSYGWGTAIMRSLCFPAVKRIVISDSILKLHQDYNAGKQLKRCFVEVGLITDTKLQLCGF
jgi:hypothetical protein